MVMDEFVTVVLGFLVGCATTAALYIGLLGMVGAAHVVRCTACNHWMISQTGPVGICTRCSHPLLRHPVRALRRQRTRGRGLNAEAVCMYGPPESSVLRGDAGLLDVRTGKG
ncbi:Uncharacterised protein [Mycobacteroides abscessus subsp. abscessus]|nr:Uncharacterised protein [Mycobacteroides abscessus subsp. abscessus]